MPKLAKDADRNIDEAIGRRIHLRRRILELTQQQVADSLNISFQQVQKYESGINRVSAGYLYRFAVLLKVPTDYFFEELDAEPASEAEAQYREAASSTDLTVARQGMKLVRAFARIRDAKTRKYIVDLVDEIAGKKA